MLPLLEIKSLCISSGKKNVSPIIQGVDVTIEQGETFALVGESGSGKSITALSICGLLTPPCAITQGEIWFNGQPLHSMTERQMQKVRGKQIGFIFQDPMTALNPTMKVGTQIAETLVWHEKISWKAALNHAIELMYMVGIVDPVDRSNFYPFQLSGGLRQRIMIAIALACKPLLLIADEPTTALDVTIQAQILELIQELCSKSKMGLLLITHDLGVVGNLCSRVAVMRQGKIVETATIKDLFTNPVNPYTRMLLSAAKGDLIYA